MKNINYGYILVSVLASGLMGILVARYSDQLQRKRDEESRKSLVSELKRGYDADS